MSAPKSHRSLSGDSHREETASLLTHAVGMLFSIGALVTMLAMADGGGLKCASALVLGCRFCAWRRLPCHHAFWHLFVFAGSACHVLAPCRFVF
ncbi:MAG: hypothetical protein ACO3JG_10820 [Luteolibacter sp.]